ncbi:MAG: bifunctional diaminohydroxyphosphoribosylaminopyrimidine deaminase/5-amino-6-(5-phosphoribosylamino)uracil reductase RibD [Bdellovibrionales bacterium]
MKTTLSIPDTNIKVSLTTDEAMELAISQSYLGWGKVLSNPLVGSVILSDKNEYLGAGAHLVYGEAHAEVNAVNSLAGEYDFGSSTIFVTLEPCAHTGKTAPCSDLIINKRFKRVVIGQLDPNPAVAGKGKEKLEAAGIEVELYEGVHETALDFLNHRFFTNMRESRCIWTLKTATSLDGKIALDNGESQWITNPASRDYVQYLRAGYDAVAIGKNTFTADDPRLNSRAPGFEDLDNYTIVFDTKFENLKKVANKKIASVRPLDKIVFVGHGKHFSYEQLESGIHKFCLPDLSRVSYTKLSEYLYSELNISSVLLEGGARLIRSFLKADMFDSVYSFIAPKILGSHHSLVRGLDLTSLDQVKNLKPVSVQNIEGDILGIYLS